MEENASRMIEIGASVLIVVGIFTAQVISLQSQDRLVVEVSQFTQNADHRLSQTYQIPEKETYTGAQVQQMLNNMIQLDLTIEVEGTMYPRGNRVESSDVSNIDIHKKYDVQYEYDPEGNVSKIIFL